MTSATTTGNQIVFVDGSLSDLDTLLGSFNADLEVIVLDPGQDGLAQIVTALAGRAELDAIHIVSHGAEAALWLGRTVLTGDTLASHATELESIGAALSNGGDLLLYGCDVAAGGAGQQFIDDLAALTGVDVAASTDPTGSSLLGGNWQLEASAGDIETVSLTIETYAGTLGTYLGTSNNDNLVGSASNDYLYAYAGNDTLQGGAGADTMYGGTGNDFYYVDSGSDVIVEYAGEGSDWIYNNTSTSYSIYSIAELENLWLYGSSTSTTYYGYGSEGDNALHGNTNATSLIANYFYGYGGNDFIYGYGGNDTLYGAAGNDYLYGQNDNDNLYGGTDNDYLVGDAGNDLLDGGSGDDTMYGGTGDDTYYVDTSLDFVYEYAGEGTDTVNSYLTFQLGTNFEKLTLLGALSINATGNELANLITGNSGNNVIDGGAGADTLQGGYGDDTYIVDNAGDSIVESSDAGTDLAISSVSLSLAANVENLELSGGSSISGYGNTLANYITGNSGNNYLFGNSGNDTLDGGEGGDVLDGGTGNDSLIGGAGDDTYYVDSSGDTVFEVAVTGTDWVYATLSSSLTAYTLGAEVESLYLYNYGYAGAYAYGNSLGNTIYTYGSIAFNVSGDAGNDTIYGYDYNDTLSGGSGSDEIYGGAGNDLLNDILENASDTLDGGIGADTMNAGDGNDTYHVDNAGDVVAESYDDSLGGTSDTVYASVSYSLGYGIENLVLTGSALTGTGNSAYSGNTITGNASNNTLDGGAGSDTLIGGAGDDTYVVDSTNDVITEDSGQGTDAVQSSATTYTLGANVENLTLTGSADIAGIGNTLANVLTGNGGDNTITGGGGSDTISGGIGYDTAVYSGNLAAYTITAGSTTTVAHLGGAGSDGTDSLTGIEVLQFADQSYNLVINQTITGDANANSLPGGLGNDTISGLGGNDTIDGDAGNDNLAGGTENDLIYGGTGHDTLDGGTGNDAMLGGQGNDLYYVDSSLDVVTESADEGNDWIYSYVNLVLPANVENGYIGISGSATLLTGNELDNALYGSSARADSIVGGAGNDYLTGYQDTKVDTLVGGMGDDTYVVFESESIVELAGEGTDTVQTNFSFTLAANFENLVLMGGSAINGTGNSAANNITGNAQANTLDGQGGADTLSGGGGNDIYVVDNIGDTVIEDGGGGTDLVQSSVSYTLSSNVEHLTLTGFASINATGNSLSNALTGNSGANLLDGGLGADSMTGGGGNDTYVVDDVGDSVGEGVGQGTDTVQTTLTGYTLGNNVENLKLLGSADLTGSGNTLANRLTGNAGNNTLDGGSNGDILEGGEGDDLIIGGAGDDVLDGGLGADTAMFSSASTNYSFSVDVDGIVTLAGPDGTDLIAASIESLQFTDRSFSVTRTGGGVAVDRLVSAMTPDYDTTPSIAILAGGGSVVAWEEGSRVHTVLFNAYGQQIGSAVVDDSWGNNAHVTALTDGGYVVTYYGYENDTSAGTYGVIAKRFDASGGPAASLVVAEGSAYNPTVAGLSNGGFAVSWQAYIDDPDPQAADHYDIQARAYGQDNTPAGLAVTAIGGVSDQYQPRIAAIPGGGFVISGQDYSASPTAIRVQRFDNAAAAIGALLRADPATNWPYAPEIGVLNDGGFVAVWTTWDGDSDGIYFQRFDAAGAQVGGATLANSTIVGPQGNASVAGLANGGFVVTWESDGQDGSGYGIYARRFGADGAALGAEFQVNSLTDFSQSRPDVVAAEDGGFSIVWRSEDPSADGIYMQQYDADGATRGGLRVDGSALDDQITFAAAVRPVGAFGQGGNDSLLGGQAADSLDGGEGNDTLDGGSGADTMSGGADDDTYYVDNLADLPVELSGDGYDRVISTVSEYVLPELELEELVLTSGFAYIGTGNSFANRLIGNEGANWLTGGGGNDTLLGGTGSDWAFFSGELKEYVFGVDAYGQISIRHDVGSGDGTDTLIAMARAQFADGSVGLNSWTAAGSQQPVSHVDAGDTGNAYAIDSVGLSNGNLMVGWYGSKNASSGTFVSLFDAAGKALGQSVQLGAGWNDIQLATFGGGAVAAWFEYDSGLSKYLLKTQLLEADGTPTGSPVLVAQEAGSYSNLRIAATSDGGISVTWNGDYNGSNYPAHAVHMNAAGTVGSVANAGSDYPGYVSEALPDGSFLVLAQAYISSAWHNVAQRYDAIGTATGGIIDLGVNVGWSYDLAVTKLVGGGYVVGWTTWNNGNLDAMVRAFDANWNPASAAQAVHSVAGFNQEALELAAMPGGGFVAVWRSDQTTQGDIYARVFDASANPLTSDAVVNGVTTGNQTSPTVVVQADGGVVVAWRDTNDGRLYQAHFDADGNRLGGLEITGSNTSTRAEVLDASDALQPVHILAQAGNDSLVGGTAKDKLEGGDGNDTLDGGGDADTLIGGKGNDTYVFDGSSDSFIESEGQGLDTVLAKANYALPESPLEDIRLETGNDATVTTATGNSRANTLVGNALDNVLNGGIGADTMQGGAGDDTYVVDNTLDVVIEAEDEGIDTVLSSVTRTLSANVERLVLEGTVEINGTGNALDNLLDGRGNTAANVLTGLAGNDVYIVSAGDTVVEAADAGIDTVRSYESYSLAGLPNVENIELLGAGNITATGNTADNVLTGNPGGNVLTGGAGNDTLDGGTGTSSDTLVGGTGNDVLHVNASSDVIIENAGEGTDTAFASVSYVLSNAADGKVENLTLEGTGAIDGTGNDLANILTGNDGDNILDGGAGNDTMAGGAGNDTYVIDSTSDIVTENADGGIDTLRANVSVGSLAANVENLLLLGTANNDGKGNVLNNTLTGNSGANSLDGGLGADTMTGAGGNDVYVVDDIGDVVVELSGGGTDKVRTTLEAYVLPAYVEQLELASTTVVATSGNALANYIWGNAIANEIDGGAGADTMEGGKGDDIYYVDSSGDVVIEQSGEGNDSVLTLIENYILPNNVEELRLGGAVGAGKGNFLSNVIYGNAGNNTLDGGANDDIMIGGPGDDVYKVDNPNDLIIEQPGEGTDRVESTISFDLASNVENLTLENIDNITLLGNGDNTATGNELANVLIGNNGNNLLDGRGGNDTMQGGLGNDIYIVEEAGDVVTELLNQGTDLVRTTLTSYTLGSNFENLTLETGAVNGTGNELNNVITGNDANNSLVGGAGNDTLDGGKGADTLVGNTGDDDYYIDNAADLVVEQSGQGSDAVFVDFRDNSWAASGYTFTLAANVEDALFAYVPLNLLTTIIGNTLGNLLQGNEGANKLNGGAGADTMEGGKGNDIYVVDSAGDVLTENGDEGTDTVETSVNLALGANLENLVLTGTATQGTGNAGNNAIVGNSALANVLNGGAGADTMTGGAAGDTYYADTSLDQIVEGAGGGIDKVVATSNFALGGNVENLDLAGIDNINGFGNTLDNTITGNNGNNVIDGGAGKDIASYQGAGAAVNVNLGTGQATGGGGNDTLIQVEGAQGGAYNDSLAGSTGDNTLDGGGGFDTMSGGAGNDVYFVDSLSDVIVETDNTPAPGSGGSFDLSLYAGVSDTVNASISYSLGSFLENLELLGSADLTGTGNELRNELVGNDGNNLLRGLGDIDTLSGGLGNDTLEGGSGNDILDGGAAIDTARFGGVRSAYVVTKSGMGWTVVDTNTGDGDDGTDTVTGIEQLQFSDGTFKLVGSGQSRDFNGDSKSDILLTSADGTVALWQMNGGTVSAGAYPLAAGSGWTVVDSHGDYNGDGKSDMLITKADGTLAMWLMNGSAVSQAQYLLSAGSGWNLLDGHGDFNGDGKSDILLTKADGTVVMWQMNGGTVSTASYPLAAGSGWTVVDSHGDYNGDGKSDMLIAKADGTLAMWLMNGSVVSQAQYLLSAGSGWSLLDGHGDFNGDGKSDILLTKADGTVVMWQMNGTAISSGAYPLAAGSGWSVVDSHGDYNGDGKSDMLIAKADGTLAMWLMNGSVVSQAQYLLSAGSGWSLLDGHGDFNGDGKGDILLTKADGTVALWQMNGTAISAASYPLAANSGWKLIPTQEGGMLTGDAGANSLTGTGGGDTIAGGLGNDTLTGGAGADLFRFDTAPNAATNLDTVTDFLSGTDHLQLENAVFTALSTTGAIPAGSFISGAGVSTAADANDFLIYNTTTGALYYDPDGTGGTAPTQFASLTGHPALAAGDFVVS